MSWGKRFLAFIAAIFVWFAGLVYGNTQVNLEWEGPTTNTDGTPLTDLAGFKVYHNGEFVADTPPDVVTFSESRLDGEHCYYVTAFNSAGNESDPSETKCKTINTKIPGVPTALRVF